MKQRLHAFGKLPAYRDFVSHECTGDDPLAFRVWLEGAFGADLEHPGPDRAYYVLRAEEGARDAIVGLVRPSRDQAERTFPFSLFVSIRGRGLRKTAPAVTPTRLAAIWHDLARFDRDIARARDLADVQRVIERWESIDLDRRPRRDALADVAELDRPLSRIAEPLGASEGGESIWARLLWGLENLADVETDWLARGGLRIPIVFGPLPAPLQVELWIRRLAAGRAARKRKPLPDLFTLVIPADGDSSGSTDTGLPTAGSVGGAPLELSSASLVFRPLDAEDRDLLRHDREAHRSVLDFTGRMPPLTQDGYFAYQERLARWTKDPARRIRDLLDPTRVADDVEAR